MQVKSLHLKDKAEGGIWEGGQLAGGLVSSISAVTIRGVCDASSQAPIAFVPRFSANPRCRSLMHAACLQAFCSWEARAAMATGLTWAELGAEGLASAAAHRALCFIAGQRLGADVQQQMEDQAGRRAAGRVGFLCTSRLRDRLPCSTRVHPSWPHPARKLRAGAAPWLLQEYVEVQVFSYAFYGQDASGSPAVVNRQAAVRSP